MRMTNPVQDLFVCFVALVVPPSVVLAQEVPAKAVRNADATGHVVSRAQILVPNRPGTALFQGEQGRQKTEIHFDPASQTVTIKMLVQDPKGYFVPNIRRSNFVVYENGVRQQNATVEIEHAAASIGLLLECGGRYKALTETLRPEVFNAVDQFLDEVGRDDKIAIWKYGDTVEQISDFSKRHDAMQSALAGLQNCPFSELNLYDALIATLERMQPLTGRKALILISTGLDTFSKADFEHVLQAVRQSNTPVYTISLGPIAQLQASISPSAAPYARLDWRRAEAELMQISNASGGRMYSPASTLDLSGIYDDLMENLRVRYVITYKSTSDPGVNSPRSVRIELVDPKTGEPLQIVDASGRPVHAKVIVEDSYVPRPTPSG
jgi:VWFA-related protein